MVDDQLRQEASRYALCFTCDACAHFAPERLACGNGYPTEPHRLVDLARDSELLFCKDFELV